MRRRDFIGTGAVGAVATATLATPAFATGLPEVMFIR
ncbi:MAG: twin-arginine translocation signal domain-containing protein [Anderseniella sp.]